MAAADLEFLLEEEPLQELHPGLAPLRGLGRVPEGLERELRQAWAGLVLARGQWLRWEVLWAGLRELVRQDPPRFRKLEDALILAQLRLEPRMMASVPPPEDPAPLLRLVLPALERHLEQKVAELADYHGGGAPPGGVAQALANEMERLNHARRRSRALREQLSHQRQLLSQVLGRIAVILGRIAAQSDAWTQRDRRRGRYLEAKGVALLLKIRLEELRVLLDTYPPGLVEAHRSIRSLLEAETSAAVVESSRLRGELSSFRALGPEFESQVREYRQLRERLHHCRWALRQLRPDDP